MQEINDYFTSWGKFRRYCEKKAKDRCHLTSNNWLRLREYHLDLYLKSLEQPFGFLFRLKYRHPKVFKEIHCMPYFYHLYKTERMRYNASVARRIVEFPDYKRRDE